MGVWSNVASVLKFRVIIEGTLMQIWKTVNIFVFT